MPKPRKPKVGFYDLAGCNGCLLSVLFNEDEILEMTSHFDIKSFRFIKDIKDDKEFDVVFMEGLVASNDDLEVLKHIRSKTKLLVALGSCACTGCIPAYRNFIDTSKYAYLVREQVKELTDQQPTPIDAHVGVDFFIPGCPPDHKQILTFMKDVLLLKTPQDYDRPVCFECRLNENRCLLDDGKMCLGPVTKGGCNSICTNGKFECWGCRGSTPDANLDLMKELLLEKGFTKEHIRQRMRTFVGMKIETPPPHKPIKVKKEKPRKKMVVKKKHTKGKQTSKIVKPVKKTKKAAKKKSVSAAVKKPKKKPLNKKMSVKKVKKKPVKKPAKNSTKPVKKAKKPAKKKAAVKKKRPAKKPAKKSVNKPGRLKSAIRKIKKR